MTYGLEAVLADVPFLERSINQSRLLLKTNKYTHEITDKISEAKDHIIKCIEAKYEEVRTNELYTNSIDWFNKNPELKYAGLFMLGSILVKGLYITGLIFPIMEDEIPHVLWGALGIYGGYRFSNEVIGLSPKKSIAAAGVVAAFPLLREILGEKNPYDCFHSILGIEFGGFLLNNYITSKSK